MLRCPTRLFACESKTRTEMHSCIATCNTNTATLGSAIWLQAKMSLIPHLHPPPNPIPKTQITTPFPSLIPTTNFGNPTAKHSILTNLISLSLSIALSSPWPSLALPALNSLPSQASPLAPTTPFSQSKNLPTGLENGKVRPCPSFNPGCVSTNPKSSNFKFPWQIPPGSIENAVQKLQHAILTTQRNAKIQVVEDTPYGQYLQAEVDGGIGRDVMEFLVKGDVVTYRCMATKVNYVYPFTTAFGDSKGQQERMKKIVDELGWYAPSFDSVD